MNKPPKLLTTSDKLYITLLVLSTLAILYGTLFPSDYKVPDYVWGFDKVAHLIMFGLWTFFYGIVRFTKGKFSLLPVLLVGVLFGLIVEMLQLLLPTNRSAELFDFIADVSGSGFAVLILYLIQKNITAFKSGAKS